MGPAGSGKTTIGELLAVQLGWEFSDGDNFHSPANIEKMSRGIPLTDADRLPWLDSIHQAISQWLAQHKNVVLACSALKRSYRDLLLAGRPAVRMVFLDVDRDLLAARLAARHGHFFRADLLASQLADLENPQPAERILVLPAVGTPEQIAQQIISRLQLASG